jgi:hypothetical protein
MTTEQTYFYDTDNNRLGNSSVLLPIPLYKGMHISIHSYKNEYEVVDWHFHFGHPDEETGLRIILKETSAKAKY